MTSTTTEQSGHTIAPDAPRYITIKEAVDALGMKPWPVGELVEAGELRAIHCGALTLVSAYDVEQWGATTVERATYGCPSWCVTGHDAEMAGDDQDRLVTHYSAGRGVPGMDNIRLELGDDFADGSGGLRVIFGDGPSEHLDLPIDSARVLSGVLSESVGQAGTA